MHDCTYNSSQNSNVSANRPKGCPSQPHQPFSMCLCGKQTGIGWGPYHSWLDGPRENSSRKGEWVIFPKFIWRKLMTIKEVAIYMLVRMSFGAYGRAGSGSTSLICPSQWCSNFKVSLTRLLKAYRGLSKTFRLLHSSSPLKEMCWGSTCES